MSLPEALVLAVVQGATEFLPVSSSGHLVLASKLLGLPKLDLGFVIFTHFGTLLAVFVYYWRDFWAMLRALRTWRGEKAADAATSRRLLALLLIGTIPAALIGWQFEELVDRSLGSVWVVGIALLATALLLVLSRRLAGARESLQTRWQDAIVVGIAQAVAIIPGLSRSGMTICSGLMVGFSRDWAPRFTFLLSAPVILGGTAINAGRLLASPVAAADVECYLLGMVVAAIVGLLAIHLVVDSVRRGNLLYFGVYCAAIGSTALIAASAGWLQ